MIWKGSRWRLINSEERGILMGYGFGHCQLAWSASQIKQNPSGHKYEKCSLIGDAFSIFSFAIVGPALCREWIPQVHYQHLAARTGLAPGFRVPLRLQAPLARRLQYGCRFAVDTCSEFTAQELNRFFLGRTSFTGSDSKVSSGDVLNPRAHPRQPVCADWWVWSSCVKF